MAEFQLSKCNLAAALIEWQEGTLDGDGNIVIPGLNFGSKTVAIDDADISNSIRLFATQAGLTDKIARGLLYVQLSAGALTVEGMCTAEPTTDFSSPTFTTGSMSDTNEHFKFFDITAEKPVVTLKRIAGGAGATITSAGLFIFRKEPDGLLKGRHEPKVGFIALDKLEGGFNLLLPT